MTAQMSDIVYYEDREYDLAADDGTGLFDASGAGLRLAPSCTACWRGYRCVYRLSGGRLTLDRLLASLGANAPPTLNGVTPNPPVDGEPFSHIYDGLALAIPFTGTLTLARKFIRDLYVHMGHHPPWKYREVVAVRFESGTITSITDISASMALQRERLARTV